MWTSEDSYQWKIEVRMSCFSHGHTKEENILNAGGKLLHSLNAKTVHSIVLMC